MSVEATLQQLVSKMEKEPAPIENLSYTYQFDITDQNETYQLDIQEGKAAYMVGEEKEPRLTLQMSEEYFQKLAADDLNAAMAYMSGKLKVKGDMTHALKFQSLVKQYLGD
ncbi:SCP2 sterol-binding domain-containing protein [Alkalicoccus chagannorensis]|uniref:SCP2 sterol-binding domain-containing protein n=1 Tax=Alkalicoccus chagannorensis TaxID=427072 RepID=UPI000406AD24|nr:SCP2 sterol-binding domain-containing protein [Alkalicoccus chagannorensis]